MAAAPGDECELGMRRRIPIPHPSGGTPTTRTISTTGTAGTRETTPAWHLSIPAARHRLLRTGAAGTTETTPAWHLSIPAARHRLLPRGAGLVLERAFVYPLGHGTPARIRARSGARIRDAPVLGARVPGHLGGRPGPGDGRQARQPVRRIPRRQARTADGIAGAVLAADRPAEARRPGEPGRVGRRGPRVLRRARARPAQRRWAPGLPAGEQRHREG